MTDIPIETSKKTLQQRPEESSEIKYKGVRKRKWGKWVSEIRLPNSRERIWLGSYDKPEKAARAFDAALYCLRGRHANFNFPDTPPEIPGGHGFSAQEIQAAAAKFAADHGGDSSGGGSTESDREQSEPVEARVDGAIEWPLFDTFDDGIYYGFENIMGCHEEIYNNETVFSVGNMEEDDELVYSGGDFSHQSNYLWNFDNY